MACPRCTGPSESGLCQSCQQEQDQEWYEGRAEEMLGVAISGPDAEDRHIVGGDADE